MSRTRILAAAAATAALAVSVVAPATAAPVDVIDANTEVCLDRSLWEAGSDADTSIITAFSIAEGSVYEDPACEGEELQGDAFDALYGVWLEQGEAGGYYGDPTELTEYTVDQSTAADGDVVITGPVEEHFGLDVQVEHRYYVEGDLARVLVTYSNPSAAPITVVTGADSGYGSDDDIEFLATSSGDAAPTTVADSWAVTSDGGQGDPVLSAAWQLPGAQWTADEHELYGEHGEIDNFWTGAELTVPAGGTVRLAYFVKMYGYEQGEVLGTQQVAGKGLQATFVGSDVAAAEARAISGVSEWSAFTGRLVEGLAVGTVVANWGTVGGAAPATPVVVAPAFTG